MASRTFETNLRKLFVIFSVLALLTILVSVIAILTLRWAVASPELEAPH